MLSGGLMDRPLSLHSYFPLSLSPQLGQGWLGVCFASVQLKTTTITTHVCYSPIFACTHNTTHTQHNTTQHKHTHNTTQTHPPLPGPDCVTSAINEHLPSVSELRPD